MKLYVPQRPTLPSSFRGCCSRQSALPLIYTGHDKGTLHIEVAGGPLCPVAAILNYMVARGNSPGPLFTWEDVRYLTRDRFVAGVRTALSKAGYTASDYAGHSFRIGAAKTASQRGVQDSLIQTLGRWQSSAYTRYIRTVPETLRGVTKTLARDRGSPQS